MSALQRQFTLRFSMREFNLANRLSHEIKCREIFIYIFVVTHMYIHIHTYILYVCTYLKDLPEPGGLIVVYRPSPRP